MVRIFCFIIFATILFYLPNQWAWAQPATGEFVAYQKQSSFIKEFATPFEELGLRGITTDLQGDVWFYHSTNTTSTLVSFNRNNGEYTKFPVEGESVADNPIINLASSQLAFDSESNAVWFTDARTNYIGKLDVESGRIDLQQIPTDNSGPMGIALSPDGSTVWFTEITGNKIARIDPESMEITEYSTGNGSGPALLTFDDNGILWVTLSFSNSVLRVDTLILTLTRDSNAMTELRLPGKDLFSPFGIAVLNDKVYVSDHGSSRVTVSDTGFANYVSYWTSTSKTFPTTLPSQVIADKQGNIYFPQHGGNRISVIDKAGVMTEYEIPTGPLSTAVFIAASDDGKVWFTEWASNRIAYLDTTMQIPFRLDVKRPAVTLDTSGPQSVNISLNSSDITSPVSLSEVDIRLTGMTEAGLSGLIYNAQPPRVNLQDARSAESEIQIRADEKARPGNYVAMVKVSAHEKNGPEISKLYPVKLKLDVPEPVSGQDSDQQTSESMIQSVLRIGAPIGAAGLIAFAIYRWKKSRNKEMK